MQKVVFDKVFTGVLVCFWVLLTQLVCRTFNLEQEFIGVERLSVDVDFDGITTAKMELTT